MHSTSEQRPSTSTTASNAYPAPFASSRKSVTWPQPSSHDHAPPTEDRPSTDRQSGQDLRRRAWILVVTQQSDQAKARLSPAQTPWPLNRTRSRVRTSGSPQPSFALGSS